MRGRPLKPVWRFLLSYLIVLSIPMALSLRVYQSATQMAYENAYASTQALLMKSSSVIDQNLDALWNYLLQVRASAENSGYFALPDMRKDGVAVADYRLSIAQLPVQTVGRLTTLLGVYSVRGNCIMTSTAVQPQGEADFGGFAVAPEGADYQAWIDFLNGHYSYSVISGDQWRFSDAARRGKRYLPLAHSVVASNGALLGNVMLFLHVEDLLALAGFDQASDYESAFILDRDGAVLLRYDGAPQGTAVSAQALQVAGDGYTIIEVEGKAYLVNSVDQSTYGWRYLTATLLALVRGRVGEVSRSILTLIAALTVLGLALVCYFAYRNARPLQRMISALHGAGEAPLDYKRLDASVASLIEDSTALKSELERQQPVMRAALFSRWLLGDYREWAQLEKELERSGLAVRARYLAVITFSYENIRPVDAVNSNRAIIKTVLREQIHGLIEVHEPGYNTMAFAVAYDGPQEALCLLLGEQIRQARQLFLDRLDVDSVFAGSVAERPSGVSIAYSEARRTLEERGDTAGGQAVFWYDTERQSAGRTIFYPIEIEMKLIDCMKAGDTEGAARVLILLRRENAMKNMLDLSQCKQLVRMLQATLMRLYQQRGQDASAYIASIQQVYASLSDPPSPEDYLRLERVFLLACRGIAEEEALRGQRLGKQLERYIEANWRDPQLSLQRVADHIGYTTAYMSRVFQQETGELFSVYVEKLRTHRAAAMLEAGGMSVEEVALATGYSSAQVFRRAFRRQYDCAPVEYLSRRSGAER